MRTYFPGRTELNIKNRFGFLARNQPEARELKTRFQVERDPIDERRRRSKRPPKSDRLPAEGICEPWLPNGAVLEQEGEGGIEVPDKQ
jgi:hypothetical protein